MELGVLERNPGRFFWRDSLRGVSSTMRLAKSRASSSQPAMAAADRNPGLSMLSSFFSSSDLIGGFSNGVSWPSLAAIADAFGKSSSFKFTTVKCFEIHGPGRNRSARGPNPVVCRHMYLVKFNYLNN